MNDDRRTRTTERAAIAATTEIARGMTAMIIDETDSDSDLPDSSANPTFVINLDPEETARSMTTSTSTDQTHDFQLPDITYALDVNTESARTMSCSNPTFVININEDVENLRVMETMKAFATPSDNSLTINVEITDSFGNQQQLLALVDSGASAIFMNLSTADRLKLKQSPLRNPVRLILADGSTSTDGSITKSVLNHALTIGSHVEKVSFLITSVPGYDIVLGMKWLLKNNPIIDWVQKSVKFQRFRQVANIKCI